MPPPSAVRRFLAVLLLGVAWLPAHRLLDPARTGLAGAVVRDAGEALWTQSVLGSLLVVVAAGALGRLTALDRLGRTLSAWTERLAGLAPGRVAAAAGVAAGAVAAAVAWRVFGAAPTSVDEMTQLVHARALLSGSMAFPLPGAPEAWVVQNGIVVEGGWASVYAPLHTVLLAVGLAVGGAWLVGPIATGVTVAFTVLTVRRLLPEHGGLAVWTGAALALCPFLILLGATALSHATAAAAAAVALWAALRTADGLPRSAVPTGMAMGALVCIRPWTGLVLGSVCLAVAAGAPRRGRALGGVALGGVPFAALLLAWNARLFGGPLRLGYTEAFGPGHGLGFHADPWGNQYGPLEALGYTGADFAALGVRLFESPLPALVLVAAALLTPRSIPRAAAVIGAWMAAGALVVAPYWHHGRHLGPRLLHETTPLWVAAAVGATALLFRSGLRPSWLRGAATWTAVLAWAGSVALVPPYVVEVAAQVPERPALPATWAGHTGTEEAVVFVHGSAASRTAARLVAAGMRRDSVETALRRNDFCSVRRFALWRSGAGGSPPSLDLTPRPGTPPALVRVEISPGNVALTDPSATLDAGCLREFEADRRAGTVELEPLLWAAPPVPGAPVIVARDLGPAGNARVRAALPGRTAWLAVAGRTPGTVEILPYAAGMALVWGGAAGVTPGGG
ncbi:MAG: hypothetical protein RJQ04_21665 [Longimicrobiales bacterium]